jgi:hypothetical protein
VLQSDSEPARAVQAYERALQGAGGAVTKVGRREDDCGGEWRGAGVLCVEGRARACDAFVLLCCLAAVWFARPYPLRPTSVPSGA